MTNKKIGVYPGSFDPFTNGHLYLVKQAALLFDEVIIMLAANTSKKRRLNADKMVEMITKVLEREGLENVRVERCEGLIVRRAQALAAQFLIRGLRDGVDYKYEENLAEINYHLAKLETVYFRAGDKSYISSSMVMELVELNEPVDDLVPAEIIDLLNEA